MGHVQIDTATDGEWTARGTRQMSASIVIEQEEEGLKKVEGEIGIRKSRVTPSGRN